MPIYEYMCGKCGKHFEKRQGFDEKPVALCPVCSGDSRRLIQCVPVIFKGSGFYVTDCKKDSTADGSSNSNKDSGTAVSSDIKKEPTSTASSESGKLESGSTESKKPESKAQPDSKTQPKESKKE